MSLNAKLISIAIAILAGLGLAFGLTQLLTADRNSGPSVRSGAIKVSGQAQIGGPFTLVNHRGETVTEADFIGKPMLVYFGFSYCADICPTALQNMNTALNQLDSDMREKIQPVFVTVDPERDTPEALELYVTAPNFPTGLVGLTGTPEQIQHAADAYRVYYARIEDEESYAGYFMDHLSAMFLMNETGQFADLYTDGMDPQLIAQRLQGFLETRDLD